MNLSVCIPIHNFDVTQLVHDLVEQAIKCLDDYEFILIDDKSSLYKESNRSLSNLPKVNYTELPQNIGRSAIRNLLVKKATFEHILFMDCDTQVVDQCFLQRYMTAINDTHADCIIGGCCYHTPFQTKDNEQSTDTYYLRWYYGIQREQKLAITRNEHPYRSFSAFNCLIKKSLFNDLQFDESLREYGHEDTLLGWEMKKRNFTLVHIDNPLYHLGIDTSEVFLTKTESSVKNLWLVYQKITDKKSFREDIKLLQYQHLLEQYHLLTIVSFFLNHFKQFFKANLLSSKPKMLIFDLYKLATLCQVSLREGNQNPTTNSH